MAPQKKTKKQKKPQGQEDRTLKKGENRTKHAESGGHKKVR